MPNFNFASPGGTAYDMIVKTLALRDAQDRQARLDALNEQNIKSIIGDREADRKVQENRYKQESADKASNQQEIRANRIATELQPNSSIAPETTQLMKDTGRKDLVQTNAPMAFPGFLAPNADVNPGQQPGDVYKGTAAQQHTLATEEQAGERQRSVDSRAAETAKPEIVREFEFSNQQRKLAGQPEQSFADYQNEDANRKKVNTGNDSPNLEGPELDMAAITYLQSGQFPPGRGNLAVKLQEKIMHRAVEISNGTGTPAADVPNVAANTAEFKANQGALAQNTRTLSAITAFENTAKANFDILTKAAQSVPDTGSPIFNQPLRAINRQLLGSGDMAAYDTAMKTVVPEIAKILTNPNLTGVLTDSSRREVEDAINGNMTLTQLMKVRDTLFRDMDNRKKFLSEQNDQLKGGTRNQSPVKKTDNPAPMSAEDLIKKYSVKP